MCSNGEHVIAMETEEIRKTNTKRIAHKEMSSINRKIMPTLSSHVFGAGIWWGRE